VGNINAAKVTALGLSPGRLYRQLKAMQQVQLPDGTVIRPQEVKCVLERVNVCMSGCEWVIVYE